MTSQAPVEMPIAATVKLTDALWRRAKIEAIRRGIAVSEYVKGLLEADLAASEHMTPRSARNGKRDDGGER